MKRYFFTLLCLGCILSSDLSAQIAIVEDTTVTGWKKGGFVTLTVNQVSLTNWAAGGESALSATALGSYFWKYRSNGTYFETVVDGGLGVISTKTERISKNEDKLEINSKFGRKIKGKFYYAGLMNFRTQFLPGFNLPDDSTVISDFMAPAYLSLALGIDYKPNDWFSLFLSPATGRATFVNNQTLANAGQFGVTGAVFNADGSILTPGENLRLEFGAYLRARFQKDIDKNISIVSNLQMFTNYTDPIKEQRANTDVNWETILMMKANKWLTVSLFTNLVYDHDVKIPVKRIVDGVEVEGTGPRTQFKEVLGVGISFKF